MWARAHRKPIKSSRIILDYRTVNENYRTYKACPYAMTMSMDGHRDSSGRHAGVSQLLALSPAATAIASPGMAFMCEQVPDLGSWVCDISMPTGKSSGAFIGKIVLLAKAGL
jgi:hypothetical protein